MRMRPRSTRSTCEPSTSPTATTPACHRSRHFSSIVASNVHGSSCSGALYDALVSFAPMANLINITMSEAQPVDALGELLFDGVPPDVAARAVTNLIALGSVARRDPTVPGLLPCRVHSFYRGLAGLWVCMDPQCASLSPEQRGGPAGMLFSQPRDTCDCGARVLELYTCRNCGTAYGRAYTNDVDDPNFLWSEPGGAFRTLSGQFDELAPIDLLLEKPVFHESVEPAEYDLVTGRLNPQQLGPRNRQVYLRAGRLGADATISHLTNGGRVANVSIATDESFLDKNSGDKVDRTEWHRIVTFQDGLVEMMEKHAKKGRLVYVSGKLQTRKWRKDGEDSDRFSTEILLVPGGRVQFLDKPNSNGAPAMNGDTVPSAATAATVDDSEIPF